MGRATVLVTPLRSSATVFVEKTMRLQVHRTQSESSKLLGGKKFVYSLRLVAELTNEETQTLNKYGYLTEEFVIDPDISANIEVRNETKGPHKISITQLQKGIEWSCDHLPSYFANIPTAVHSQIEQRLGIALARENWRGDEIIGA